MEQGFTFGQNPDVVRDQIDLATGVVLSEFSVISSEYLTSQRALLLAVKWGAVRFDYMAIDRDYELSEVREAAYVLVCVTRGFFKPLKNLMLEQAVLYEQVGEDCVVDGRIIASGVRIVCEAIPDYGLPAQIPMSTWDRSWNFYSAEGRCEADSD